MDWPYFRVQRGNIFLDIANTITNNLNFFVNLKNDQVYIFDDCWLYFLDEFLFVGIAVLNVTIIDIFARDIAQSLCDILAILLIKILFSFVTIAATKGRVRLVLRRASWRMVRIVWTWMQLDLSARSIGVLHCLVVWFYLGLGVMRVNAIISGSVELRLRRLVLSFYDISNSVWDCVNHKNYYS